MFDTILTVIEIIGVVSFSISGTVVSIDKEMDLFGVIFLAIMTSFGGGVIRDLIIGRTPLFFTSLGFYVLIGLATSVLVFTFASVFKKWYVERESLIMQVNNYIDALGIGAFSVTSVKMCIDVCPEKGAFLAIMMGMTASIGGGMIRDICLRDIPFVFRKHIYALAAIAGSVLYYLLMMHVFDGGIAGEIISSIIAIATVFAIRVCATKFKWNMPKAIEFSKMHGCISDTSEDENKEEAVR